MSNGDSEAVIAIIAKNLTREVYDQVKASNQSLVEQSGSLKNAFGEVRDMIERIGAAAGIGFSVGEIVNFARETVSLAADIKAAAERMDVSVESAQRLKIAVEENGGSFEALQRAAIFLNQALGKNDAGTAAALEAVGLGWDKLNAMDNETRLRSVAKALSEIEDPIVRDKIGVELLGRGFGDLWPTIKNGLDQNVEGVKVMSTETVNRLAEAESAWKRVGNAITVFTGDVLAKLIKGHDDVALREQVAAAAQEEAARKGILVSTELSIAWQHGADGLKAYLKSVMDAKAGALEHAAAEQGPHISAIQLLHNTLDILDKKFKELTPSERVQIAAEKEHGASVQELAEAYNKPPQVIQRVIDAQKQLDEEHKTTIALIQKFEDRIANLSNVSFATFIGKIGEAKLAVPAYQVAINMLSQAHEELTPDVYAAATAILSARDASGKWQFSAEQVFTSLKAGQQVTDQQRAAIVALADAIHATGDAEDRWNTLMLKGQSEGIAGLLSKLPAVKLHQDALNVAIDYARQAEEQLSPRVAAAVALLEKKGMTLQQAIAYLKEHNGLTDQEAAAVLAEAGAHRELLGALQNSLQALREVAGTSGAMRGLVDVSLELVRGFQLNQQGASGMAGGIREITGGQAIKGWVDFATNVAAATANILSFGKGLDTATQSEIVMSDTMKGAQIGSEIWPGWGTLIGAGVGALIGAFTTPEYQVAEREIGNMMGVRISDGLAMGIAGTEETVRKLDGSLNDIQVREVAELLNIQRVIAETGGINAGNIARWSAAADNLFSIIKMGGDIGKQAVVQLGGVLDQLIAAAGNARQAWGPNLRELVDSTLKIAGGADLVNEKWGTWVKSGTDGAGLLTQGLIDVIAQEEKLGITTANVAQYRLSQVTRAESGIAAALKPTSDAYAAMDADLKNLADLNTQLGVATDEAQRTKIQTAIDATNADLEKQQAIIKATSISSQGEAAAVAAAEIAAVDAKVKAGQTWMQAILSQKTEINNLRDQLVKTGFDGGDAFKLITREVDLASNKVAGPALTAMEGYTQSVVGLNNAGLLTKDMYAGLESRIGSTEKTIESEGFTHAETMAAMQNDLQVAWELQEKFPGALDDTTAALVKEAEQQGIVGETHKSTTEQMLDLTKKMVEALDKLAGITRTNVGGAISGLSTTAETTFGGIVDHAKDAGAGITDAFKNLKFKIPVDYDVAAPPTGPGADGSGAPSFANEGFVRRPTLAKVGDAPGERGEWILHDSTVRNLAGGSPLHLAAIQEMTDEIRGLRADIGSMPYVMSGIVQARVALALA